MCFQAAVGMDSHVTSGADEAAAALGGSFTTSQVNYWCTRPGHGGPQSSTLFRALFSG